MRFRQAMVVMVVAASAVVSAQAPEVKLPMSPRGTAEIQVGGSWVEPEKGGRYTGGSWITIDYGRPLLRTRDNIFGTGASYGKKVNDADVWRAGANDTTRLTTQVALEIGGKALAPGVYNVFVDLKENAWTLVLTTQPVQPKYDRTDKVQLYGSYNYDPKFDVLRAPMRISSSAVSIEQFTIGFADVKADRGSIYMAWDKTVASVDFAVKK
jgi:hypothetical protein